MDMKQHHTYRFKYIFKEQGMHQDGHETKVSIFDPDGTDQRGYRK